MFCVQAAIVNYRCGGASSVQVNRHIRPTVDRVCVYVCVHIACSNVLQAIKKMEYNFFTCSCSVRHHVMYLGRSWTFVARHCEIVLNTLFAHEYYSFSFCSLAEHCKERERRSSKENKSSNQPPSLCNQHLS